MLFPASGCKVRQELVKVLRNFIGVFRSFVNVGRECCSETRKRAEVNPMAVVLLRLTIERTRSRLLDAREVCIRLPGMRLDRLPVVPDYS